MLVRSTRSVAPLLFILALGVAGAQVNLSELVKTAEASQVRAAIGAGAALDVRDEYGLTALMNASHRGRVEIVQELIKAGAHLDVQDRAGWTALMYAARHGPIENVRALIDAGADTDLRNRSSMTALRIAMHYGTSEMVELLAAAAEAATSPAPAVREAAPQPEGVVRALMLAAADGSPQKLLELLNAGAELEARDEQGRTALMHAARTSSSDNLQLLLNAGADPNAADHNGQTPLIYAAREGKPTSIRALILAGAKRDLWDDTGWTALMYAQLDESEVGAEKVELLANFRPGAIAGRPSQGGPHPSDGCVSRTTTTGSSMNCYSGGRLSYQSTCTMNPRTYEVSCRSQHY